MRHFTFQKEEITSVLQNRISELKKAIKITEENLQELPENAEKLKIIKIVGKSASKMQKVFAGKCNFPHV